MAKMIEYLNPQAHTIQLSSPEKKIVKIPAHAKVVLSDWYLNYCPKYLRVVRVIGESKNTVSPKEITKNTVKYTAPGQRTERIKPNKKQKIKIQSKVNIGEVKVNQSDRARSSNRTRTQIPSRVRAETPKRRQVVGRRMRENSRQLFNQSCQKNDWAISNNIGVGILSYNRLPSIQRLINSIRKYTDLSRVTVFVSDESTNDNIKNWLKKQTDIVVMTDQPRLGIAGNTNRLLRCLSRFRYGFILNDDVEILNRGWEIFYRNVAQESRYHHFCYHQEGVYGAKRNGRITNIGDGYKIETITSKPHGAVMFFTNESFKKVGFFDESFGLYGMEHVDWSQRISQSGLQPRGFHDVVGSDGYFKIYQEHSAVPNRTKELQKARAAYKKVGSANRVYVPASPKSKVPSISVIVPIRNIARQDASEIVINSIRAQLFPNIELIIAEQDQNSTFNLKNVSPCQYFFAKNKYRKQPFTKAMAFNLGIANATNQKVVLQDADIICTARYLSQIYALLDKYEGVHIGAKVLYMSNKSTAEIVKTKMVDKKSECERAVGYFEGGSLACTKAAYFRSGGFNEIFEGYGVEDCDFFERLKFNVKFHNVRTEDFVHMWHGRTPGWETHHRRNKQIGSQLRKQYNMNSYIASLVKKLASAYPQITKELKL